MQRWQPAHGARRTAPLARSARLSGEALGRPRCAPKGAAIELGTDLRRPVLLPEPERRVAQVARGKQGRLGCGSAG